MDAIVRSPLPSMLSEALPNSRAPSLRGHYHASSLPRARPPPTRSHPSDGFVDGLQSFGFPPPCHPSYGASGCCPGGTAPTEHVCLLWTHTSRTITGRVLTSRSARMHPTAGQLSGRNSAESSRFAKSVAYTIATSDGRPDPVQSVRHARADPPKAVEFKVGW